MNTGRGWMIEDRGWRWKNRGWRIEDRRSGRLYKIIHPPFSILDPRFFRFYDPRSSILYPRPITSRAAPRRVWTSFAAA